MQKKYTIIYAFRNRDRERIQLSLKSLDKQLLKNFEVLFVDYGSSETYAAQAKVVVESYDFAKYYYLGHQGLLWNKSKALNFAINLANAEDIFIADVDVIFISHLTKELNKLQKENTFTLFKIGYLPQNQPNLNSLDFELLNPTHYGDTFGIGLFTKKTLQKVKGLDTFFHFYGSEDSDLNSRLVHSGCKMQRCDDALLLHQWHPRYHQKKDNKLTIIPRLNNIERINQRHYLYQKNHQIHEPIDYKQSIMTYSKTDFYKLSKSDKTFNFTNIKADVEHFLNHILVANKDKIIKGVFKEDPYYKSIKLKLKNLLGKNTQQYIPLKKVNDKILKKIVFNYRHYNYSYKVSTDLKEIHFVIDLKSLKQNTID